MDAMLEILKWIQSIRTEFLNDVFTGITIIGEEYTAIAVISLLLWCVNTRWGYRLGFAYLFSGAANNAVKEIFHVERPFLQDPELEPIRAETATGHSFPSGHTQGITALMVGLATIIRKKWFVMLTVVLVLLVAFSRLYLGVHTPADVVVGIAFGVGCVFFANWVFDQVEKRERPELMLFMLVPLAAGLIWLPSDDYIKAAGAMSSFVVGYVLDRKYIKYEPAGAIATRAVQFAVGMAVGIAIKAFGPMLLGESLPADFARYFLIGAWATIGAPLLFQVLFSRRKVAATDVGQEAR